VGFDPRWFGNIWRPIPEPEAGMVRIKVHPFCAPITGALIFLETEILDDTIKLLSNPIEL
jgi:hypothetical protein